jgi:hypothetical protein
MGLDFLQIADRHVDGRAQVNFEIGLSFGSSVAQPNDYSTQGSPPRIICRMRGERLINR